jgi:hypothetical protein
LWGEATPPTLYADHFDTDTRSLYPTPTPGSSSETFNDVGWDSTNHRLDTTGLIAYHVTGYRPDWGTFNDTAKVTVRGNLLGGSGGPDFGVGFITGVSGQSMMLRFGDAGILHWSEGSLYRRYDWESAFLNVWVKLEITRAGNTVHVKATREDTNAVIHEQDVLLDPANRSALGAGTMLYPWITVMGYNANTLLDDFTVNNVQPENRGLYVAVTPASGTRTVKCIFGSSAGTFFSDFLTGTETAGGDLSGVFSNLQINAGTVGVTELSATGTPNSTKFLRGDNAWSTVGSNELSATGTKDATTFLRGDNTWAVPAGGGGGGGGASTYTTSTIPSASSAGAAALAFVSDESPSRYLQISDGTSWYDMAGVKSLYTLRYSTDFSTNDLGTNWTVTHGTAGTNVQITSNVLRMTTSNADRFAIVTGISAATDGRLRVKMASAVSANWSLALQKASDSRVLAISSIGTAYDAAPGGGFGSTGIGYSFPSVSNGDTVELIKTGGVMTVNVYNGSGSKTGTMTTTISGYAGACYFGVGTWASNQDFDDLKVYGP